MVVPSVLVEWLDASVPSLAVTGPNTRNVTVSLDVIAMCGDETEVWSIKSIAAPAGQTVQIDIEGVDWLSSMRWSQWGVQLTVRARIYDEETGRILDLARAPERWIRFDAGDWVLLTEEEQLITFDAALPDEEGIAVAALPPAVRYVGVP